MRTLLTPMRTYNPGYGGGASGIASGVSITAPPYRQPVIKESHDTSLRRNQILEQLARYSSTPYAGHTSLGIVFCRNLLIVFKN